ncbi:MAG TPA: MBL fold metallo-hydrolase [Vicinamibacterales bacterium]|jgi:glyoxylase-like metal-dependent hydrolase (beta-lactamase superfamily II)|nr:MBL fold metallo-hydrolase [Vicinamibacterales bacterium]
MCRRSFAVVLVAGAVAFAVGVPAAQKPSGANAMRVQLLHPGLGLYVLIGGGANTMVLERGDDVVVVDPKPAGSGPAILQNVESITERRVTTVVLTNGDADHAGASGEFPSATRIVAHEATARRMKAAGARGVPTTIVTDRLSLFDRPPQVEVYYFGRGHTDGDLVVAFPETGVVHMGDLFPAKAAPVIDAANGGSGVAFPETLARVVKALAGYRRVSTGHDPGPVPPRSKTGDLMSWSDLEDYAEFTRVFLERVRASMTAGLTAAQAAKALEMPEKFKTYDMREAAANVATIYRELGQ